MDIRVSFTSDEKDQVFEIKWYENTWFLEYDNNNNRIIRRWKYVNGDIILDKDFVEDSRRFTKKEYDEFISNITIEDVIEFEAKCKLDDTFDVDEDIPYREWAAYKDLNYEYFKFFYDPLFRLTIRKKDNIDDVIKEFNLILKVLKKKGFERESYTFGIFDKDLSLYGPRYFKYNTKNKTVLLNNDQQFSNIKDCFTHIQKHYYYS